METDNALIMYCVEYADNSLKALLFLRWQEPAVFSWQEKLKKHLRNVKI